LAMSENGFRSCCSSMRSRARPRAAFVNCEGGETGGALRRLGRGVGMLWESSIGRVRGDGGTWAWRWLGWCGAWGLRGRFGEKETRWRASARRGRELSESEEAEEVPEECGERMRTEREREGGGAWPDCRTRSNRPGLGIESNACCGACWTVQNTLKSEIPRIWTGTDPCRTC
jgi:hypothetical protein